MNIKVLKHRCPQDHKCPAIKVCPGGALEQAKFFAPKINEEKCIGCGECVNFCPMKAIVEKDARDFKKRPYVITASGEYAS